MNTVKIIHTADLHLGSARTGVKNGRIEIENTFYKIINLCKTESVDFLLIAGDLFDSPYQENAENIIAAMAQIPETTIAIAPGNHDPACPGSVYLRYKFPDNVVIFQGFGEHIDFPEKNVRLYGGGFTDRFEKLSLMRSFDSTSPDFINICVLHADLVPESSASDYNPITAAQIEVCGFDYLALGHIHKRSEMQKLGKTHFAYPGCPDGMGFDELGSHGIYIGEIGTDLCKLEYREISSRQYIIDDIVITDCANSFDAVNRILNHIQTAYGEEFNRNLYRIRLCGELPADTVIDSSQVQSLLTETLNHIRIEDCTDTDISDLSKITAESSLRGIFAQKMLAKISVAEPDMQETYRNALKIGLKAFNKGVKLDDN